MFLCCTNANMCSCIPAESVNLCTVPQLPTLHSINKICNQNWVPYIWVIFVLYQIFVLNNNSAYSIITDGLSDSLGAQCLLSINDFKA